MNDLYKNLYIKYKTKYKNLQKKSNQIGGSIKLEQIEKMYRKIPDTGLYGKNISLKKFIKYCTFLKEKTKNEPDILDLKKKIFLEKKKMTDTKEYTELVKKIKDKGKKYQKMGNDFEKKVFNNILDKISSIKNISNDNLKLYLNPSLYLMNHNEENSEEWLLIGEVDAIIINGKDIVAIVEIKKSFDDIPDGLFQISRSYQVIKQRNNRKIKLITNNNKDILLDSSFNISNNLLDISFIFTSHPEKMLNLQSKIKFILQNILHIRKNIKYKKIFKKIKTKKESLDKLNNKIILRYDKGVLETIEFFKKRKDHLLII
tara:strand:- start:4646 stop:5593 length:948 start_codon:yes stop_codon:yes gene_type:complete